MLRTLPRQGARAFPSNSRARRRQERAWRQWPACTRPFASPAPGRGIGAPYPPIPLPRRSSASASSICNRHLPHQPGSSSCILPPYAAQLRVGPEPKVVCRSKSATPPSSPFLQGTAPPCSSPAAIPQGLASFLLCGRSSHSCGPSSAKTPQSLPGSRDTAVPAVGAESVRHPGADLHPSHNATAQPAHVLPATHCAGFSTVFPGLTAVTVSPPFHRSPRISVGASYLNSKDTASSRGPSSPASTSVPAHTLGPSRPRPRRPSAQPFSCQSLPAAGSLRSPVRGPVKASQPSRTRPPPGPRSTAFRALGHWETLSRASRIREGVTPTAGARPNVPP